MVAASAALILVVMKIFAGHGILSRVAEKENREYWVHRGMRWNVVFELYSYEMNYYFQLQVVPNAVAFPEPSAYSKIHGLSFLIVFE